MSGTLTVTNQWKIVVKGLNGRFQEVFIDPQTDYAHAKALAQAYTLPNPDPEFVDPELPPGFVPEARVIREGAVVGLLDALIALVKNQGPAEIKLAREAVLAAVDPNFDTALKDVDAITMEAIAAAGRAGGQAFQAGTPKLGLPESYEAPGSEILAEAWRRGWEAEFLQRSNFGNQRADK